MSGTSGPAHMFPDAEETTQYQIRIPSDDWNDWKRTVPRSVALYERIHSLIQIDAAFDGDLGVVSEAESADDVAERLSKATFSELRLLTLKVQRLEQRAQNCKQWLDEGDMGKLREEVDAMEDLAGMFSED